MKMIWTLLICILGIPVIGNLIFYTPLIIIQKRRFKKDIQNMVRPHIAYWDYLEKTIDEN